MSINLLAISVGNTRTRVGAFLDDKLTATEIVDNTQPMRLADVLERVYVPLRNVHGAQVVLGSVNPAMAQVVADLVQRKLHAPLKRVEQDLRIPIGRQLDPEAIVGEDRLLNAAAAYSVLQQACVVVDAGTAITIDFIDGAGTFHGGAIAPGAQMMLDSLHEHTAQLPEVQFEKPAEPIGHNTIEAMRSAVFHGVRGMVRELVEQYAEVAGGYPMVVATGGNAEELFHDWELIERVVPDLTLMGIATTLRKAVQESANEE